MDREEILKRSRQEKRDEGMSAAENKGRKIGAAAFCAVCAAVVVFSLFRNEEQVFYAAMTMFWAYCAAEAYPVYRFTRKTTYLVTVVAGSIAVAAFFALFVLESLGFHNLMEVLCP